MARHRWPSLGRRLILIGAVATLLVAVMVACVSRPTSPESNPHSSYDGGGYGYAPAQKPDLPWQTKADADAKSQGCVSCHDLTESATNLSPHAPMDSLTLHAGDRFYLGCTDCHGGDATATRDADTPPESEMYHSTKARAHVEPRLRDRWLTSANPQRLGAEILDESFEFVRFVNPGDLRVAHTTCGVVGCHPAEVAKVRTSLMTHGAMLWSAALYNNGAVPFKDAHFGEAYGPDGTPLLLRSVPPPTAEETRVKGVLPELWPLPRWNVTEPGNILRVFERGGRKKAELGNPNPLELPGEPENKLSNRGYGTILRTDPVFIGLQKTRLLDPMLSFLGTNDHPGDYRSSGCTACHVVYANDRDPTHTGPEWAATNNRGFSATKDRTIPREESGHPMKHVMTRGIPSSQCIVCHVHPGTSVENSYFGTIWWDNETDGEAMYLKAGERRPTPWETDEIQRRNPENAALRGRWSDPEFLAELKPTLNPQLKNVQFADFHGHGWVFRNVYSQNRSGDLLDGRGEPVAADDPKKFEKAVHLQDIHAEMGMHCVDCHFEQDSHGDGKLYGEMRAAIEIRCEDCHGTVFERATLKTSGPAAPEGGHDLTALQPTPKGKLRFEKSGDRRVQRGMVEDRQWDIVQVADTLDPTSEKFNRARYAHTIRKDNKTWGDVPGSDADLAHPWNEMNCISCHTSWTTSCFGCHLPMVANQRKPMLHGEGDTDRNWVQYNFQTLRNDVFMLGKDGTVAGKRISPVRSSCAVLVGSQNDKRQWIYSQQQTVSAGGFSGHAFTTYVPHTVRGRETKTCTDCHVSAENDNNAWLAQVTLLGTNFVNFIGHYCWVATGEHGYEAIAATERTEPQAVIGSNLHRIAYPEEFASHVSAGRELHEAYHHEPDDVLSLFSSAEVLGLQLRGEYAYAATGTGGLRVFDVANVDNKDFSERTLSAPVSPMGQQFVVRTRYATAVAAPATVALDPVREVLPENEEQKIHPLYAFIYVSDQYEGLVMVNAATLLDGNPANNFLERAVTFNPDGVLDGAVNLTVAGTHVWVCAAKGLVDVDVSDPMNPRVAAVVGAPHVVNPRSVAVQFRYAFVVDSQGLKVVDVTNPDQPRPVEGAAVSIADARQVYVSRTYAYVAAGKEGLKIVDVKRPEKPVLDQTFDADGAMDDVHDVKIGMTNNSLFGYVADGENGLRVLELVTSGETPGWNGFSPRPTPKLIATFHTEGPALAISEGLDRDRAVDESGNQVGVFNRRGARPFNREELRRLYLDREGKVYSVTDEPTGERSSAPRPMPEK